MPECLAQACKLVSSRIHLPLHLNYLGYPLDTLGFLLYALGLCFRTYCCAMLLPYCVEFGLVSLEDLRMLTTRLSQRSTQLPCPSFRLGGRKRRIDRDASHQRSTNIALEVRLAAAREWRLHNAFRTCVMAKALPTLLD
mmetsp:Transcript_56249/g.77519  ORF Transcript_56249/g.77519 Transcript_56249/m.77519 type:complete len:139 (-) Transcript_56249:196-612(-)|eukprot:scaffold86939_cov32-Tisochrysis_lutea.AAC.2